MQEAETKKQPSTNFVLIISTNAMAMLSLWVATTLSILLHQCSLLIAYSIPNEPTRQQSMTMSSASTGVVAAEVNALTHHPAVWSTADSARKKLKSRHLDLFSSPVLFDEFASVVCETGRMARKEVFETWAAALYIDARFSESRRIADIAAGHGLLAWALLLVDDARFPQVPRTALCIDKRMPPSAEAIELAMLRKWPHLSQRFDFVQGSLEQLEPHKSCLLVSVHACAGLSDILVAIAAKSGAPIALVPCCHSRKKLDGASMFAQAEYDAIIQAQTVPNLAERLDEARCAALRNAGFDVAVELLPKQFTAKNTLIMASLSTKSLPSLAAETLYTVMSASRTRVSRMPPLHHHHAKTKFLAKMAIPCENSPESLAVIAGLSGRAAADRRIDALHRRNHNEAPQYDISMWLPPTNKNISAAALSAVGCAIDPSVCCLAVQLGTNFEHPSSGRQAATFRVRYTGITEPDVSNEQAKRVHNELYSRVAEAFPGAKCR